MDLDRKCIDSLKGIGILGVVLVHYGLNTSNELLGGIVANGARGVQLLFIVNGFLIFNSLDKLELTKENVTAWWKKKFLRLIPMYYFFTILSVLLLDAPGEYWLGPLPRVSWLNVLCNLLFIHGFFPYYTNSINANWFMGVLGIFYILAPFLYKVINSLEKSLIAVLVTASAGYILRWGLLGAEVLEEAGIWNDYVNIISFPAELPIILLGILAYYIYKEISKKDIKNKTALSYAMTFFSVFCMLSLFMRKDYFVIFNNIFSFGVLFMLLLTAQLIHPMKLIRNALFGFIGKHSYGVYLSHLIIMKYVKQVMTGLGDKWYLMITGYLATLVLALLAAVTAEKIIEERLQKIIEK